MPTRFPKNAQGDFYTTGSQDRNGEWCGDCLACGLPENEAPDLLAKLNETNIDTYFIKQPVTSEEINRAIAATKVCCVDAVRYGGKDKDIISRIHPSLCDYRISESGNVVFK